MYLVGQGLFISFSLFILVGCFTFWEVRLSHLTAEAIDAVAGRFARKKTHRQPKHASNLVHGPVLVIGRTSRLNSDIMTQTGQSRRRAASHRMLPFFWRKR